MIRYTLALSMTLVVCGCSQQADSPTATNDTPAAATTMAGVTKVAFNVPGMS